MNQETPKTGLMHRMMHWLHLTCEDTSSIISESLDHSLPFSKWWRLKLHLAICAVCGYYLNQLKTIRTLAHSLGKEDNRQIEHIRLRPEFKEKLKQALKIS